MDKIKTTQVEAATFKKLLEHLQKNSQVQNIDLMDLADFCRNCLSKWYVAEAENLGEKVEYEKARELVYGMPYKTWKKTNQKEQPISRLKEFNKKDAL